MAWFRRRALPAGERPPLARDERVVAWARTDEGVLAATNLGLWLPGAPPADPPAGPPGRVGWHEIHKAVWTGRELAVTAAREVGSGPGYTVVADLPTVAFPLAQPGALPHQVRARVTRSVGYTAHHPLPGGGGFRVAARRVPGVDGLRWTVRYDTGVNRDDAIVGEVTDRVVEGARAS
jgi:hypothetical protein